MQNEAQYNLDRKAAKISALSSNNLDKYGYLTGEDLGLKPSTVEQAKFDSSPLGKIFNKGLYKDDQKEGLSKRLKNIENAQKNLFNSNDKNKPDSARSKLSLPSIFDSISSKSKDEDEDEKKHQNNNMDSNPLNVFEYLKSLIQEAEDLVHEIKDADDDIGKYKLIFIGSNREKFNFNIFRLPLNFLSAIYNGEITLKKAERDLGKKIQELKFNYKLKNVKEKRRNR